MADIFKAIGFSPVCCDSSRSTMDRHGETGFFGVAHDKNKNTFIEGVA